MTKTISILLSALLLVASPLFAEVRLASPFTDHMVLQCDLKVPVWGTADAGEKITVEFAGQIVSTKADADGKWSLKLKPMKASAEPHTLVVIGKRPKVSPRVSKSSI